MKTIYNTTLDFTVGALRSHKRFCKAVATVSSFAMLTAASAPAFAGTAVLGGDATLSAATGANLAQNTDAYAQFVSSGGASAVLDWSKFDIGAGKEMNFSGAGTTFFNLVDAAASKSQIDGLISGNGSVWVVNPNGIAFGANSQVNIGGIFAAAAGNISNADALRTGTATMPEFSSFNGSVSTAAGSSFTAGQVALLGKTVSASGDFTGVSDLSIGAAGKLTVDEVAGGKISVDVADFAADSGETSVVLGDLFVGDLTYGYFGGDLNVRSGNAVDIDGKVFAGGNVSVFTKNGNINVAADGGIESIGYGGEVDLVSAMSVGGKGDININGFVGSDGYFGTAYIYAGYGEGGVHSTGDLNVNGVARASAFAQMASFNGDMIVGKDGIIVAADGGMLDLSAGNNIVMDGTVSAKGGLNIQSNGGKNGIAGSGQLSSGDESLTLYAGAGDVAFAGKITAGETLLMAEGNVSVENGKNDFSGTVSAYGDAVSISDANGVAIDNVTARDGDVNVFTADGNVRVVEGGNVVASKGDINLISAMTAGASGDVIVDGDVNSGKNLRLFAGYGDSTGDAVGSVAINGYVRGKDILNICAFDGTVAGSKSSLVDASEGRLVAQANNGGLVFDGAVAAKTASFSSKGGDVSVGNTANNLSLVQAEGQNVKIASNGDIGLGNVNATGNIDIDAAGDIAVIKGYSVKSTGQESEVSLASSNGGVSIRGDVEALGNGSSISVTSAGSETGNGDIVISGGVLADGQVYVGAGYTPEGVRSGGKGGITLEQTGGVISYGDIAYLFAAGGNGNGLDLNGYVNGAGGVALASRDARGIYSSKSTPTSPAKVIAGVPNANNDGVAVASPLLVQAFNGDADLSGIMTAAGDASISASGDVKAMNANDLKGKVSAVGRSVELSDINDLTLGDVVASDGVSAASNGKLTVDKDATIAVSGDGAELSLASLLDDVVVNGSLSTDGQAARIILNSALTDNNGSGDIRVNGSIDASGKDSSVELIAGSDVSSGSVIVDGTVVASGKAILQAGLPGGGITVNKGATVSASGDGAEVRVTSGFSSEGINSDIDIKGNVLAEGDNVKILIGTGGNKGGSGNVYVSGNVQAKGEKSDLRLEAGNSDGAVGNILISGTVHAEGDGALTMLRTGLGENAEGSLRLEKGGEVSVDGKDSALGLGVAIGRGAKGGLTADKGSGIAINGDGASLQIGSAIGENAQGDLTLNGKISVNGNKTETDIDSGYGTGSEGNIKIGGEIDLRGNETSIIVVSGSGEEAKGSVVLSGSLKSSGETAMVDVVASMGKAAQGSIDLSGKLVVEGDNSSSRLYAGYGEGASGDIAVSGNIASIGANAESVLLVGYGTDAQGSVDVSGRVTASGDRGHAAIIGGFGSGASGSARLGGSMAASKDAQIRVSGGNVTIDGSMSAGNNADVIASNGGNLLFGNRGIVSAGATANVLVDGNVSQSGNAVAVNGGNAGLRDVAAAVKADTINIKSGGSIGGKGGYLGVDGKVHAIVGEDAYIASATGTDFRGGDAAEAPSAINIAALEGTVKSIDLDGKVKEDKIVVDGINEKFDALGGTSAIVAGGNLSIYTARKLEANGLLKAERNITVSASDFGDVSYLQAGGTLTINNVGKPASPKIAYFESVNGIEPKINNQPNDTVIFVDGRLAGGNLKILNQFGADEAFMVSTPELKSTQGIFGSPTFLHSDLDVANPMEVGSIDYMLQETPRLTLDKDFPKEADQHVDSVVIPERDSFQFGRGGKTAEEKPLTDVKISMAK